MSEVLPHPVRPARPRGPRAWLFDRLVPGRALAWGRLTVECRGWLLEMERLRIRLHPSSSRLAFERLARTMGEPGKVTPDAPSPAVFNPRLLP